MKGLVFNIKRFSIHDGPGIRVTVFMKGCPLTCKWCHNPEGIHPEPEPVLNTYRIGGQKFQKLEEAGKYYSVEEIIEILERERIFINNSKGGVTFSGGEPMMQFEFLNEVLKACKSTGFHTAVDTSGYSLRENYISILPVTDLFLFDLKHMSDTKHVEATGVSNEKILDNYRFLVGNGSEIILRIPVIPGFNDDDDHIKSLIQFIKSTKTESLKKINLLPYHKIGISKYTKFNLPYKVQGLEPPSMQFMKELRERFGSAGVQVKIGG